MSTALTAASVPAQDRLAHRNHRLPRTLTPTAGPARAQEPLVDRGEINKLGYLQVSTLEAGSQHSGRVHGCLTERAAEFVAIALQDTGSTTIVQDGRTAHLLPGDLAVYDIARPHTLHHTEPFRLQLFQLPRRALGIPEAHLRQITARAMPGDQGAATTLVPFLTSLAAIAATCPPSLGQQLAWQASDLVTQLISDEIEGQDPNSDESRQAMARRIRDYINEHLADPDLSLESIAAHHYISLRYLHKVFEGQGITVSRWIQQRRLEECRRELGRHNPANPTVSAIAQRWGFVSPSHFSRAFRAAYGMSPRGWRSTANQTSTPATQDI